MEENETVHPDYIKGFNDGYELAKYAPELIGTLEKIQSKSERMQGLFDGQKQFEKEKIDKVPVRLREDRYKLLREKDKQNKERQKGKDDIERDSR